MSNTASKFDCSNVAAASPVRVRFAPSPTGMLHVGNVRIALFNYMFAKKFGGKFVLRMDDTDKERSSKELETLMLEDLKWLGIIHDEFYRQSERIAKYQEAFEKLKEAGYLYPCYEDKDELALKRKIQAMSGVPPVYDRASLKLTDSQRKELENNGVKPYWRFKLDDKENAEWDDLIHGHICIPLNTVSDPVVVRPDGGFMYTFASVVDDADLNITHIIRGDDHVTNTAVQINIFNVLHGKSPEFAHLPLMSSMDGQEISKRVGSVLSIVNMRKEGIFPAAIMDVLCNLGTSNNIDYHDTIETLVKKFDFGKVSSAQVKFNIEDIRLINRKILAEKTFDEVKDDLHSVLGISEDEFSKKQEKLKMLWDTVKGNISKISEVSIWNDVFSDNYKTENKQGECESFDCALLQQMLDTLPEDTDFDQWILKLKEVSGKKGRDLFHPMRMALTGLEAGPELRKIVDFLGYDQVKKRIEDFLGLQKERSNEKN